MLIKTIADYSEQILFEAERLEKEGIEYHKAFKQAICEYADYLDQKENPAPADQSKGTEHGNKTNNSIAPDEDIDNGQVFDSNTGITKRDLR